MKGPRGPGKETRRGREERKKERRDLLSRLGPKVATFPNWGLARETLRPIFSAACARTNRIRRPSERENMNDTHSASTSGAADAMNQAGGINPLAMAHALAAAQQQRQEDIDTSTWISVYPCYLNKSTPVTGGRYGVSSAPPRPWSSLLTAPSLAPSIPTGRSRNRSRSKTRSRRI